MKIVTIMLAILFGQLLLVSAAKAETDSANRLELYEACKDKIYGPNNTGMMHEAGSEKYRRQCVDLAIKNGVDAASISKSSCDSSSKSMFGPRPEIGYFGNNNYISAMYSSV